MFGSGIVIRNSDDLQDDWQYAPCALAVVDELLAIIRANACLCRLAGLSSRDIEGRRLSGLFSRPGQIYFESVLTPLVLIEGSCQEIALDLVQANAAIPVLINITTRARAPTRLFDVVIFPAPVRRSFEEQLAALKAEAENRAIWLDQLERLSGFGAWTYAIRSQRMAWSGRMFELYGLRPDHPIDLSITLQPFPDEFRKTVKDFVEATDHTLKPLRYEVDFAQPSGESSKMRVDMQRGKNLDGEPVIHGVIQDITSAYRRQKDLWHAAHMDPTTGLGNRFHFNAELNRRTKGMAQEAEFSVAVIDLDGFKAINDTYGHSAGDTVLKEVGNRLSRFNSMTGFRLGGNEFALIVDGHLDRASVSMIKAQLVAAIVAPIDIGAATVRINASIGIANYPIDGVNGEALLEVADSAMYTAKREAKDMALSTASGASFGR